MSETCQHCAKRVATLNDLYQHAKVKHGKKAAREVRKLMPPPEPSLGEELAEAVIAWRSEGIRPDSYLLAMFPDDFATTKET
jgi:hypothetical protein